MKMTIDRFSELIEKIAKDSELDAYDYLEEATCIIIDDPIREVVVEAIRVRKKWSQIKIEYCELKESIGGSEAIRQLSEKWHYSEKTIEAIIYSR